MIETRKATLENFKCQACGNCCRTKGQVYITLKEAAEIAAFLNLELITFKQKYILNEQGWLVIHTHNPHNNCFLDDTGECLIYSVRPMQCRTYPAWPGIWQNKDTFKAESKICLGLEPVTK